MQAFEHTCRPPASLAPSPGRAPSKQAGRPGGQMETNNKRYSNKRPLGARAACARGKTHKRVGLDSPLGRAPFLDGQSWGPRGQFQARARLIWRVNSGARFIFNKLPLLLAKKRGRPCRQMGSFQPDRNGGERTSAQPAAPLFRWTRGQPAQSGARARAPR